MPVLVPLCRRYERFQPIEHKHTDLTNFIIRLSMSNVHDIEVYAISMWEDIHIQHLHGKIDIFSQNDHVEIRIRANILYHLL